MNILYFTDNNKAVMRIAKQYADEHKLDWYATENKRENIDNILTIYRNCDNYVIFLSGINKSNNTNALLKTLEENNKNIIMFATANNYDISDALLSRFIVKQIRDFEMEKQVEQYLKTNKTTKDIYTKLSFYIYLAKKEPRFLKTVEFIVDNARLTTTNTPWEYYYYLLSHEDDVPC